MSYEKRPDPMSDFGFNPLNNLTPLEPKFWRHILFIPNWVADEKFRKESVKDKKILYNAHKGIEFPSSKEIPWVWFGAYDKNRHLPTYNGKSVVRMLFMHYVDPNLPMARRLKPMTQDLSDVNPWRYFPACGQSYVQATLGPKVGPLTEGIVVDLIKLIHEDWGTDSYTDEELRRYLGPDHDMNIINEALRRIRHGN